MSGLGGAVLLALTLVTCEAEPRLRDDGVVPVVLVHGYGGDSSMMSNIAERLRTEGHEVVPVDLPLGGVGDIEDSVLAVAAAADETRAPEVDVVGFSAGGVVARAYADSLDEAERPRVVVTLASPHHGTKLATAAGELCIGACEQLAPGSAFLEQLNEPDETPTGTEFFSVWTAADRVVTPPRSAVLEGAVDVRLQDLCPGRKAGHVDLLRDPVVLEVVVDALAGDVGAVDCVPL